MDTSSLAWTKWFFKMTVLFFRLTAAFKSYYFIRLCQHLLLSYEILFDEWKKYFNVLFCDFLWVWVVFFVLFCFFHVYADRISSLVNHKYTLVFSWVFLFFSWWVAGVTLQITSSLFALYMFIMRFFSYKCFLIFKSNVYPFFFLWCVGFVLVSLRTLIYHVFNSNLFSYSIEC